MNVLEGFQGYLKLKNAHCEIIKAVQKQLKTANLYKGNIDGICGSLTLAAFADFKELEYLEEPEMLGRTTAQALLDLSEEHPEPSDKSVSDITATVRLPLIGLVSARHLMPGCQNFSWGEFTKGLDRVPEEARVVQNIMKTAQYLEKVRHYLQDRRITITSGYRPLSINKACGGVSNSRHLFGDAVDFVVEGISPHAVFHSLDSWHGSQGGLGKSSNFTHLDLRGYRARWNYGNA